MQEERRPPQADDEPTPYPGSPAQLRPLPRGLRSLLFAVGSLFVLIGLAGLALPVVPQTLPLALGVAILSLASDWFYLKLRVLFRRWPAGWRYVQAIRRRLHDRLSRH